MKKRGNSFCILGLIYVLATVAAVLVYLKLKFTWWLNLLIADVIATVIMFVFSVFFQNASVYDPYWSVQPPVIVTAFAMIGTAGLPAVLMLIAVWFWGIRLTANWAYTFHGLDHQDWRYTMLHEKTGMWYPLINFVGIHMVPTLVVYACVLPVCFALVEPTKGANPGTVIGFLLSVSATTLQGIADIQMHRYRKHRNGPFIRDGLWKYSRHPNYLGEILMWWGVFVMACSVMSDRWYLCLGAVLNTILFFSVSIPMADGRQSRKEGFAEYKRQTRMLLPIRRRK